MDLTTICLIIDKILLKQISIGLYFEKIWVCLSILSQYSMSKLKIFAKEFT